MRMAVMAAGAVGGYFGGRMAAAGHDVIFIARGAHRDAIRRDGLRIESALGDLHLKDLNVTDDPKQVGPVDLVLRRQAVGYRDGRRADASARRFQHPRDDPSEWRRQRRASRPDPRR